MAKISLIFLVVYAACTLDQTVGLNFFYQTNPVYEDLQAYPYIPPYASLWQPDCDKEGSSEESSESSSSESSESSESNEGSKSSKESSSESESKESKESSKSTKSGESGSSEEKEKSSKEEEGESKSGEGSSEGSEEEKKEAPKKKKKKEKMFPPRSYPFPARQVQRIIYPPASSYAYLPYRTASSYVVQQPVSSYPVKSSIQYMSVPASQTYVRYSPPVVGKTISGPVQKLVYSAAPAFNYPQVSKTIISSGGSVYPVAGSWSSPLSYLKK